MATIAQIVAQIRTAIYGKDVRENIAQGIEKCYEDSTANAQIQEIINKGQETLDSIPEDYTALTEEVDDLKSAISQDNIEVPIDYDLVQGYIKYADGSFVENSGYRTTTFIPVSAGEVYRLTSTGSLSVFILGLYASNSGNANTEYSIQGAISQGTFFVEIPEGINYIRGCVDYLSLSTFVLHKVTNTSVKANRSEEILITTPGETKIKTTLIKGFIKASDGSIQTDNGYRVTEPIPVNPGEYYRIVSAGSISVFLVGLYTTINGTADLERSVYGTFGNANLIREIIVHIPSDIHYIRACCDNSLVSNLSVYLMSGLKTDIDQSVSKNKSASLLGRKASVSFIFDDGTSGDASIKEVFDKRNHKCGFAVYSPIADRYVTYHEAGYEILAHATAYPSTPTIENINSMLKTAYDEVVSKIGECAGFVTPSSFMHEQFRPLVNNLYEYGYTLSKGADSDPVSAVMHNNQPSYSLWRSSLESLTLEQCEAIVDEAVATGSMICFYAHAANLGSIWSLTMLNNLLAYCESKNIDIVLPVESVREYLIPHSNSNIYDQFFYNTPLTWNVGAITSDGTIDTTNSGYKYTDLIPVRLNDCIKIRTLASGSVYALAVYKSGQSAPDSSLSVVGTDEMNEFYFTVTDSSVTHIRICGHNRLPMYAYLVQKLIRQY